MQDGDIIPFRGSERRRRDDRAGRWPMPIAVGIVGFVCGALYMSAPLQPVAENNLLPGAAENTASIVNSVYYPNCAAARAAGAAPLRFGEPGYRAPLDADGDGVACEPYRPRY